MSASIELQGSAVRLRSTVEADRGALCTIRATDEVRARWRGVDLEAEFDESLEDDGIVMLTIEADGDIIGLIQFSEEEDPDYRQASLDIYLDPAVHGRGHGVDAIRTLVQYLFEERRHHRLTIDPAADNAPAIRCYSKVGFQPVGVMREYERQADGRWSDGLLMDLLVTDIGETSVG